MEHWQGFAVLVIPTYTLGKNKPLECQSRGFGFKGLLVYSFHIKISNSINKTISR